MNEKLKYLIIKPNLGCNCSCNFCESRLELYEKNEGKKLLSLKDWKKILKTGKELGLKSVHISGGEPTLYGGLIDLIKHAKSLGLKVNLNTNGILLANKKYVQNLNSAKLDSCTISLYSASPAKHDSIRSYDGAFAKALLAMNNIHKTSIELNLQTILTVDNMAYFLEFIKLAHKQNPKKMFISYLEGYNNINHPSKEDITHFKETVVPNCQDYLKKELKGTILQKNLKNLNHLFKWGVSYSDLARGIYNCSNSINCKNRKSLALILANGDIHPCNAIEYFHKPIVGNLHKKSLKELWDSDNWKKIRKGGSGWCKLCPMTHHTYLVFK
ncbi:radical SAM protein [Candidatus Woesearchaeota archaeon]|nr:radical SAM protein [Candidatus Woesearchaeota archaeon]